jgi:hypothetical protein
MIKRLAIIAVTILTVAVAVMFAVREQRPILAKIGDYSELRPRTWTIANPFRDREPEAIAENHIREISRGASPAFHRAADRDAREHLISAERKYPILSWRLRDRSRSGELHEVGYWVTREGLDGEEEVTVTVSLTPTPRAVAYNAIY